MDVVSRLDLYSIGRAYIEGRALRLAPGIVDVEGSDANLFVGSTSFMAAACVQQTVDALGTVFLDSAEGEDLDRRAYDRDLVVRPGAAPARGEVRFFRSTTTAGGGTIPIGTKIVSLTGPQYTTTATATFGPSDKEVADVPVRAVKAGKTFQLGRNQLRLLPAQTPPIFDASIQVTNDEPTAGGEDRLNDIDFRLLVRQAKRAQAKGTLDAIVFGAKLVPGISSAKGMEVLNPSGQPARVVQLYIADSSGIASKSLGQVVQENLVNWRACGIAVSIATSQPQLVSVALHLAFLASTQGTSALVEQIRASVVGFVNSLPVGAGLYLGDLYAQIRRYAQVGLIPQSSSILEPVADLIPAPGVTLRTSIDLVTIE